MKYNCVDYSYKVENDLLEEIVVYNIETLKLAAWGFAEHLRLWYRIKGYYTYCRDYDPNLEITPLINSMIFDELETTTLIQSQDCLFTERSEFVDLKDYVDYIKRFPVKFLRVNYYNCYIIKNDNVSVELKLQDEENGVYIFKEYLSTLIVYHGGEDLSEQLDVAFDLGRDSDEQRLANIFNVLKSKGYSITETFPEEAHNWYCNSQDDSLPEYMSEDYNQEDIEFDWFDTSEIESMDCHQEDPMLEESEK